MPDFINISNSIFVLIENEKQFLLTVRNNLANKNDGYQGEGVYRLYHDPDLKDAVFYKMGRAEIERRRSDMLDAIHMLELGREFAE